MFTLKQAQRRLNNYFNPPEKVYKVAGYHLHKFSPWQLADKGLAGAFSGSIAKGTIQYRRCKTKSCGYYQAEEIL